MADTPDLITIDRAMLEALLDEVAPDRTKRAHKRWIDDLVQRAPSSMNRAMRGVTPNRKGRGESIVTMAIRLAKKLDITFDEAIHTLLQTTDVWDERTKLRRELIGVYKQLREFLSERLRSVEDQPGTLDSIEREKTMQKALFDLDWRKQSLEEAERNEAAN